MSCPGRAIPERLTCAALVALESAMDRVYGARKRALLDRVCGTVVEIGPGAGANFRYYPRGTRLVAVEPNSLMHARLLDRARERGLEIEIRGITAEALDVETGSVDLVVGTLVLCSVEDPAAALAQVLRVLRPGGRYIFCEHVAAPEGTALRALQDGLQGPWRWLADGCRLNRDTAAFLERAGFASLEVERFRLRPGFLPFSPHVAGVGYK